jgi:hypothetical protein
MLPAEVEVTHFYGTVYSTYMLTSVVDLDPHRSELIWFS